MGDDDCDLRHSAAEVYAWKKPRLVGGQLQCRTCKIPVAVTEETIERWWMFNRMLRAQGQEPIAADRIVLCDACRDEDKRATADSRRREVDRLASTIRELKDTSDPQRERELVAQLRAQRHPDVDGLVMAIGQRKQSTKRTKAKEL